VIKPLSPVLPLKLSDLTRQIQQSIQDSFQGRQYWVIADVSNHTFKAETNYHYFELIEKEKSSSRILARIAAKAWGNAAVNLMNFEKATGQKFKSDIQVLVQVAVEYSPAFGLQLSLLDIDTNFTLGQFEQQRNATLQRLLAENPGFIRKEGDFYFTKNSQLPFPAVLQHIAVISSDTSAGYQDFVHTLEHNPFKYLFKVEPYFTKVQGELNARPFLNKLIEVFNSGKNYDVLVIIRGGGAQSDFLIFDNYELSRAVAKFPIPVITGIGHQKNETIVDLMAHSSTKTPTKAAEMLIAHNRGFEEKLLNRQQSLLIKTQQLFSLHSRTLTDLKYQLGRDVLNLIHGHRSNLLSLSGLFLVQPKMILNDQTNALEKLKIQLKSANRLYFLHKNGQLDHYQSLVKLMSPENILNKGFAIVKMNGEIISSADQIAEGTALTIQLADAEMETIVTSKKKK
jgi:exodeoxyribonuclease VII large subunit